VNRDSLIVALDYLEEAGFGREAEELRQVLKESRPRFWSRLPREIAVHYEGRGEVHRVTSTARFNPRCFVLTLIDDTEHEWTKRPDGNIGSRWSFIVKTTPLLSGRNR
jgi:hypothetical protein